MTQPKDPKSELEARSRDFVQKLLEAMEPDPLRDAERAAFEAEKEKEDAARILEFHLTKKLMLPDVPAHPVVLLADLAALKDYLRMRGMVFDPAANGVTLQITVARTPITIVIDWTAGQIRFTSPVPTVVISASQRDKLALAIERINGQIGQPVWRLEPDLAAVVAASTNDDGSVSSSVVEYAIALLRQVVSRDPPTMRMVLRS